MQPSPLTIDDLRRCVDAQIPPILATASADGEPNVVFISSINIVDAERIALSNQFMGKTAANLAENPHASVHLLDPHTGNEYRLAIAYERTERRGPVFERLAAEIDQIAAATTAGDVFRLRSADIYRIDRIDVVREHSYDDEDYFRRPTPAARLAGLGELTGRLSRCGDLDSMVAAAVRGLDELLGYERSTVMLIDETGRRLFTIASHGFATEGIGSELAMGQDAAGLAAERNRPVRVGGVHHAAQYASSIGTVFGTADREIPVPASGDTRSRLAVPAVSRGEVRGVLVVESSMSAAFDEADEAVVGVVAAIIAEMADLDRPLDDEPAGETSPEAPAAPAAPDVDAAPPPDGTHVRFFASDGSVFLDGDYLIRGVAGRVLWSLVQRNAGTGQVEFTTKEIRLDKSIELPEYRDNLDTRLILLKRRLEERAAPIQIVRTGRGRIALQLPTTLRLEAHE